MKTELFARKTTLPPCGDWTFMLIPTIFVKRTDTYGTERWYYLCFQWIVFQVGIKIKTNKNP